MALGTGFGIVIEAAGEEDGHVGAFFGEAKELASAGAAEMPMLSGGRGEGDEVVFALSHLETAGLDPEHGGEGGAGEFAAVGAMAVGEK